MALGKFQFGGRGKGKDKSAAGDKPAKGKQGGKQAGKAGGNAEAGNAAGGGIGGKLPLGRSGGMPIAVDFGTRTLKALQFSPGDRPTLHAAAQATTPDDLLDDPIARLGFQRQTLTGWVKKGVFKGKRAVCTVPASHTSCTQARLARVDGVDMDALVSAHLADTLKCEPSAIVQRWFETPTSTGKSEVLCLAAARALVTRLMDTLRESGLEPVGMQSEYVAVLRGLQRVSRAGESAATLYLDLGHAATRAVIGHGREPVFARSIAVGARELAPAPELAAVGLAGPAGGGEAACDPCEALTDELAVGVRHHRSVFGETPIEAVVFAGGGAASTESCMRVAKVLRVPASVADPFAGVPVEKRAHVVGVDLSKPQPGWAAAMGLCLCPADL
ncbi:MAG: hypothetical protein AAF747_00790 [Planctomycetota bacterium]